MKGGNRSDVKKRLEDQEVDEEIVLSFFSKNFFSANNGDAQLLESLTPNNCQLRKKPFKNTCSSRCQLQNNIFDCFTTV